MMFTIPRRSLGWSQIFVISSMRFKFIRLQQTIENSLVSCVNIFIYIYGSHIYIYKHIFILYNYTFIYIYLCHPPLPKTLVVNWPAVFMWFCHHKAICIVGFLAGKAPWKQWLLFWNHQTPIAAKPFGKEDFPSFKKSWKLSTVDRWAVQILTDTFPALGLEFHLGSPYFRTFFHHISGRLKNMRKSNWIPFPQGKINPKIFELPPPSKRLVKAFKFNQIESIKNLKTSGVNEVMLHAVQGKKSKWAIGYHLHSGKLTWNPTMEVWWLIRWFSGFQLGDF